MYLARSFPFTNLQASPFYQIEIKAEHACLATISNSVPFDDTPLDRFFLAYPSFKYDRTLPPAESFHRLQRESQDRQRNKAMDSRHQR
jgi:hypothetical protein